jgi:hypothetical protein
MEELNEDFYADYLNYRKTGDFSSINKIRFEQFNFLKEPDGVSYVHHYLPARIIVLPDMVILQKMDRSFKRNLNTIIMKTVDEVVENLDSYSKRYDSTLKQKGEN